MLAHNAHAVNISPESRYFCQYCCNVDAHAKNIPTLVVVLCLIFCQPKLLTQRLTTKFLILSTHSSGAPRGYLCVHMYTD